MSSISPVNAQFSVTVVSRNPSTLERLEAYLRGVGVRGNPTHTLGRLVEVTPLTAAAVVVFPDEYESDAVLSALEEAKRLRPNALLVVVTSDGSRFHKLERGVEGQGSLLVLAKPVWAWTIVDAIRARLAVDAVQTSRKARSSHRDP